MYGWLWRKLPGGWALKTLESIAMIAVVSVLLVVVVFPWIEPKLPFSDNTVDGSGGRAVSRTSPAATPTTAAPTTGSTPGSSSGPAVLPGD